MAGAGLGGLLLICLLKLTLQKIISTFITVRDEVSCRRLEGPVLSHSPSICMTICLSGYTIFTTLI